MAQEFELSMSPEFAGRVRTNRELQAL